MKIGPWKKKNIHPLNKLQVFLWQFAHTCVAVAKLLDEPKTFWITTFYTVQLSKGMQTGFSQDLLGFE